MATKKSTKSTKSSKSSKGTAAEEPVPLRRQCGAMQAHFRLLEEDPNFRMRQANLERAVARRMASGATAKTAPTVIPVVVHVVFNSNVENISTAQIKSQIKVLNRDFQAKNPDKSKVPTPFKGLVADARIKFVLANKDPDGKPTSGITRKKTTRTSFGSNDSVKFTVLGGQDAWPRDKYLNIWVCQLGGGLLGYAQFPGGQPETDGVVILHTAFGTTGTAKPPFNLGRTTTHEVGHWLNLRHIWGDTEDCSGSDFVADTPNAAGPNFGTPSFPHISCNNGPNGDMFMNYMDYVDDAAMFMFTPQQVERMAATLENERDTF
ncbi:MAG TPA: zinc metalloprotease [Pyrinomonadaceae bacterium]|nr:zinc metalloprotease [Pyrinomonadaceae bacterium]